MPATNRPATSSPSHAGLPKPGAPLSRRAFLGATVSSLALLTTGANAALARQPDTSLPITEMTLYGNLTNEEISQVLQDMLSPATHARSPETVVAGYRDQVFYGASSDSQMHRIRGITYETHASPGNTPRITSCELAGARTPDGHPLWAHRLCVIDWVPG